MKCMVIIPNTMHNYSFSAPLAWMFSKHLDQVKGIYGFELTEEYVKDHELFIVELNWFIELYEFEVLVKYIKTVNPDARILFGGLYAAMKYKTIFERCAVDYFIRGDNELPVGMLLDGAPLEDIPNLVGRHFENPFTYMFREEDYKDLDFNMDWFPSYYKHIRGDQMYQLPMVVTAKGGCATVHKECDYCMGAKRAELNKMYNRSPIVMRNDTLLHLLDQVEKKFNRGSLLILSECDYEFRGRCFDIDMNVEIDSPVPIEKIGEILHAFKKCLLNISVYEEGLCGEKLRENYKRILDLEDNDHKIRFFAYNKDLAHFDIPGENILYADEVFPQWAHWNYYSDIKKAFVFSQMFYYQLDKNQRFEP